MANPVSSNPHLQSDVLLQKQDLFGFALFYALKYTGKETVTIVTPGKGPAGLAFEERNPEAAGCRDATSQGLHCLPRGC
jgi:hypothetical protein